MVGAMFVKQRVRSVRRWQEVFNEPELDTVRRAHGLIVTGTYVDGEEPDKVIVVMDMDDLDRARSFARSEVLAHARERAGALGPPDGVWYAKSRVGETLGSGTAPRGRARR